MLREKIDKQTIIIACICVVIMCLSSIVLKNEIANSLFIGLLFSALVLILIGIWYIIIMLIKETIKEIKNRKND